MGITGQSSITVYGIGGYTSTDKTFGHIGCGKALINLVVDLNLLKVLLLTR